MPVRTRPTNAFFSMAKIGKVTKPYNKKWAGLHDAVGKMMAESLMLSIGVDIPVPVLSQTNRFELFDLWGWIGFRRVTIEAEVRNISFRPFPYNGLHLLTRKEKSTADYFVEYSPDSEMLAMVDHATAMESRIDQNVEMWVNGEWVEEDAFNIPLHYVSWYERTTSGWRLCGGPSREISGGQFFSWVLKMGRPGRVLGCDHDFLESDSESLDFLGSASIAECVL